MILGPPGSEQSRVRAAWLILACGVALMLLAWGSWVYRTSVLSEAVMVTPAPDGEPVANGAADFVDDDAPTPTVGQRAAIRGMALWLPVTLVLVLAFLFGSYAILRASRRYRSALQHRRAAPTAADDVWSMHKLQDESDDTAE